MKPRLNGGGGAALAAGKHGIADKSQQTGGGDRLKAAPVIGRMIPDTDRAGVASGNRQHNAFILAAGDGKGLTVFIGGIVVAVVKDGQRDGGLGSLVLYSQAGNAALLFIADKMQRIAAGLGLRQIVS